MTRFARSKGSKSSNERIPESATPWSVISQQLHQKSLSADNNLSKAEFEAQRKANYENFLKEEAIKKTNNSWCEFPNQNNESNNTSKNEKKGKKRKIEEDHTVSKINTEKSKKLKKANKEKDASDAEENFDADDPELSKWCDEYSDEEINSQYQLLTDQLEVLCMKHDKKKMTTSSLCQVSTSKKNKEKKEKSEVSNNCGEDNLEGVKVSKKKKKNISTSSNVDVSDLNETKGLDESSKKKNKKAITSEDVEASDLKGVKTLDESLRKKNKKAITSEDVEASDLKGVKTFDESLRKKNKKASTSEDVEASDLKEVKTLDESLRKKNKKASTSEDVEASDLKGVKTFDESLRKKNKKANTSEGVEAIDLKEVKSFDKNSKKKKKERKLNPINNEKAYKQAKLENLDKTLMKNSKADDKKCRRKPLPDKMHIIINGEEVEVATIHGFPVTSKDAERILELRKSLISKGIPRSEVDRTIKLERRRAEKALARLKKTLCFHCRKGGHLLSECPEMNKNKSETAMPVSGLCFKCGSTEHTHFNCKVVRTQDYKFAQCFICKEQGHISRQCPDNPKGIYPKGGACRVCGDVTHLRKDCPKVMQENDNNAITLETLQSSNIEDIGTSTTLPSQGKTARTGAKHVKF